MTTEQLMIKHNGEQAIQSLRHFNRQFALNAITAIQQHVCLIPWKKDKSFKHLLASTMAIKLDPTTVPMMIDGKLGWYQNQK